MTPIFDTARDIIIEQLGCNPEDVTPEAKFVQDLGADSLDCVELCMALESEFKIDISDEDAERIFGGGTVQDAVDYIAKHA